VVAKEDDGTSNGHCLGDADGHRLPRRGTVLMDGDDMFWYHLIIADDRSQEVVGHKEVAGEPVAHGLLRLDGSFGRSTKGIEIIEKRGRDSDEQVVAQLMDDGESGAVFVDIVGIKDPGPVGVDVRRVVAVD
jgi:hypothetical protein